MPKHERGSVDGWRGLYLQRLAYVRRLNNLRGTVRRRKWRAPKSYNICNSSKYFERISLTKLDSFGSPYEFPTSLTPSQRAKREF